MLKYKMFINIIYFITLYEYSYINQYYEKLWNNYYTFMGQIIYF